MLRIRVPTQTNSITHTRMLLQIKGMQTPWSDEKYSIAII